mgnify:CR=1 FL=1
MERAVLPIVVFVIVCSRTSAYAGWAFMDPLVTDADFPGVLKTYEINRKEYSTFRLYVELPTLNRNVEFRYLRKYENHDYHIEDYGIFNIFDTANATGLLVSGIGII